MALGAESHRTWRVPGGHCCTQSAPQANNSSAAGAAVHPAAGAGADETVVACRTSLREKTNGNACSSGNTENESANERAGGAKVQATSTRDSSSTYDVAAPPTLTKMGTGDDDVQTCSTHAAAARTEHATADRVSTRALAVDRPDASSSIVKKTHDAKHAATTRESVP